MSTDKTSLENETQPSCLGAVRRSTFLSSPEPAIIQDEFKAYEVSWKCQKGHINFQTILRLGTQNDICLKCGKHYEYTVAQDFA
jgi:hypothetical protein